MFNISRTAGGFFVKLWKSYENFLRNIVSPLTLNYGISVHAKPAITQCLSHTNVKHTFRFVEIFYFVEIRSVFCLFLHSELEFFN